jgi:hypothetical protein
MYDPLYHNMLLWMEAGAVTKISFVFRKLIQIDTPVVKVQEKMAAIFKELAIYQNKGGTFAEESV